jgi:hypothetical protein
MTRRYGDHPLPPRAFVPGRTERPVGGAPDSLPAWDPADWPTLEPWLHAVDLFNHGFYWECHEALEALWHAAGRSGPTAELVQGLIQVAAGLLNLQRGHAAAAGRQVERGLELVEAAAAAGVEMGFDPAELARATRAALADPAANPPILRLSHAGE